MDLKKLTSAQRRYALGRMRRKLDAAIKYSVPAQWKYNWTPEDRAGYSCRLELRNALGSNYHDLLARLTLPLDALKLLASCNDPLSDALIKHPNFQGILDVFNRHRAALGLPPEGGPD